MLILAFETSAKAASVALMQDEKIIGSSYQNTGLTHSQTLMVMAEDLLKQCGFAPSNVSHVAVAAGPGSFTGVRIGVAAAKGFAWGGEIPCCGVSTLEAMALWLGESDGYICCAMDARRSQVYNAIFRAENGKLTRVCEDRAISVADLCAQLAALDGPIYLVGDGSLLCKKAFPDAILPPEHRMHQRAEGVAIAARAAIDRGETCDGNALTPNYLRLSQAERERMEKEKASL